MRKDIEIYQYGDFSKAPDPVKTEALIFEQISSRVALTNYVYIAFPLAWSINHHGIPTTQSVIDEICNKHKNQKLFFVCQHIRVSDLDFHGHLVFTPHATLLDTYQAIPHYAANYAKDGGKPFETRDYLMSFQGAFLTHSTRSKLKDVIGASTDCLVTDTGTWNFEKSDTVRIASEELYKDVLGNTKIALCPRGTGPSTIRMWEAMASGCVPLIISDTLKMPMSRMIDWTEMAIFVPEEEITHIKHYLSAYNDEDLKRMAVLGHETYNMHFSNEKLYKTVVQAI